MFCTNISSPSISCTQFFKFRLVYSILLITSSLVILLLLTLSYLLLRYSSNVGIVFLSFSTFPLRAEKKGTFVRFAVKGLVVSEAVPF